LSSLKGMRKGLFGGLVLGIGLGLLLLVPATSAAGQRIELIFPFDGQLFEAKMSKGNTAIVRVKFRCPEYVSGEGDEITARDYTVVFERLGKRYLYFEKRARSSGDGTCVVGHRFPPGTWRWQAWVDKDQSRSAREKFYVDADEPIGPLNLRRGEANRYMRKALARKFGKNWLYGLSRQTNCGKRLGKDKRRCSPIRWYVGDLVFYGRGKIWLSYSSDAAYWNASFRITKVNEYCISQGASRAACSKTYVER
jgi:hypothetical protein